VFYQGESRWNYSTEFADLFPEMARNWNFVPRFAHILIDQSGLDPKQVQGGLRARILQLLMFAAYHEPILEALQLAAQLLAQLPETGGINYVRVFVRYLTATQEEKTVEAFAAAVEQHTEKKGRKIMTFAQQLFQEGKLVGEIRAQIEIVEKLLRAGISWTTIETATEIGPTRFAELQQELAQLTKPKETELIFSQSSQTE
ncbi:MAG: Rpn family recombination-promoting nuclease/putative transposase, partial [Caldilineaceae bacterium]